MGTLTGKVAVVAGATRGAGRGIAAALGEAGATVFCTGRSTRGHRSEVDRPETIEETAELVSALGGVGIPVRVDHLVPHEVAALAARIRGDHGHLDVLVNDLWGAEAIKGPPSAWNRPIGEVNLEAGLRILRLGVESHLVTAHHLLPLVAARPGGLHVEITDGTAAYNAVHYRISAFYDLAKTSAIRLAWSLGHELAERGGTAVALTPGFLRSEQLLDAFEVTEATWREALTERDGKPQAPPDFAQSETPRFVGRAVAALAADPDRARWNQRSTSSGELARIYGFTDLDGARPDLWATLA
jgi:NAD(P)-dependent dehydrogenase (short-subunit alcohol dehydrogenase family)